MTDIIYEQLRADILQLLQCKPAQEALTFKAQNPQCCIIRGIERALAEAEAKFQERLDIMALAWEEETGRSHGID